METVSARTLANTSTCCRMHSADRHVPRPGSPVTAQAARSPRAPLRHGVFLRPTENCHVQRGHEYTEDPAWRHGEPTPPSWPPSTLHWSTFECVAAARGRYPRAFLITSTRRCCPSPQTTTTYTQQTLRCHTHTPAKHTTRKPSRQNHGEAPTTESRNTPQTTGHSQSRMRGEQGHCKVAALDAASARQELQREPLCVNMSERSWRTLPLNEELQHLCSVAVARPLVLSVN